MTEAPAQSAPPGKWWGWGDPGRRLPLPESAVEMLRAELGPGERSPRVELDDVAVQGARPLPAAVTEAVNAASVLTAHEQRVRRAAGKSYPDLIRLRTGRLDVAPDAVVMPGNPGQVAALL